MTEEEWLTGTDGQALYSALRDETTSFRTRWLGWIGVRRFRVSERKRRLFCCACCYRIFDLIPTEEARQCVVAAERFAEGLIGAPELEGAIQRSMDSCRRPTEGRWVYANTVAVNAVSRVHRTEDCGRRATVWAAARARACAVALGEMRRTAPEPAPRWEELPIWKTTFTAEAARQADLLRDVVGNPFRPVRLDPSWTAWHNGVVANMARNIYDERRFDELPILADALEDAGCDSTPILTHCRSDAEHARGCWLVDLILGKE
jgi:hypothetical protein